jgi:hypothetical protein
MMGSLDAAIIQVLPQSLEQDILYKEKDLIWQ